MHNSHSISGNHLRTEYPHTYVQHYPNPTTAHANLIQCNASEHRDTNPPEMTLREADGIINSLLQANTISKIAIYANTTVTIQARHPDERYILGVKAGLKPSRQRLSQNDAHKHFGHLGQCKSECWVCSMAKGEMKRYTLKVASTLQRDTIWPYLVYGRSHLVTQIIRRQQIYGDTQRCGI